MILYDPHCHHISSNSTVFPSGFCLLKIKHQGVVLLAPFISRFTVMRKEMTPSWKQWAWERIILTLHFAQIPVWPRFQLAPVSSLGEPIAQFVWTLYGMVLNCRNSFPRWDANFRNRWRHIHRNWRQESGVLCLHLLAGDVQWYCRPWKVMRHQGLVLTLPTI